MSAELGAGVIQPGLLRTLPILAKMGAIEGWLHVEEADLLIAAVVATSQSKPLDDLALVEVGSYCGRSTVVLGLAVQALRRKARLYAVDPHAGVVGQEGGLVQKEPTLTRFTRSIKEAGIEDIVEVVQKCSHEVTWNADLPIDFLFVDGLHDYANVARDFHHFETHLRPGALVAFHDYDCSGVAAFVDELLVLGRCRRLDRAQSLIVVEKA